MSHYRKGFARYLPEILIPKYRPRILDNIIKKDEIVGKIVGMNLKPIDFNDGDVVEEFIKHLYEIKEKEDDILFIENSRELNSKIISRIEKSIGVKMLDGENHKINNVYSVMRSISKILNYNLETKEALLICHNKEKMKGLIKKLSKNIKFAATLGSREFNDEIYDYVLEETGLSIFFPNNIDKILKNYDIIIILENDLTLDLSKLKKTSAVFNFGKNNSFYNDKGIPVIEDFLYDLKELDIVENKYLPDKISTSLFECLGGDEFKDIGYLYFESKYYTLKEYSELYIRIKGRF